MSALKPLFGGKRSKAKGEISIVPEGMRGGVFYIRVSTDRQEESGNGLDAQKEAIRRFAENNKVFQIGDWYQETGSGGAPLEKRPILLEAIEMTKRHDVYLVTSKLDRLSRKAALVSNMLDDKFKFVTVEHGFQSDDFVIRILAALAQKERELIGERTKAALKQLNRKYDEEHEAALARGETEHVKKKLGIPDVSKAPNHISHRRREEGLIRSRKYMEEMIAPTVEELRRETGRKNPNRKAIADKMNAKGLKTVYGSEWTESIIYHTVRKIKAEERRIAKAEAARRARADGRSPARSPRRSPYDLRSPAMISSRSPWKSPRHSPRKSPRKSPARSPGKDIHLRRARLEAEVKRLELEAMKAELEAMKAEMGIRSEAKPEMKPEPIVVEIIESPVRTPVKSPVRTPMKSPVRTPMKSPVRTPVKSPVRTPMKSPVRTPIKSSLKTPVRTPMKSPVKSQIVQSEESSHDE